MSDISELIRICLGYARVDPNAVKRSGEHAPAHAAFHRKIVLVALCSGVAGLLFGIFFSLAISYKETTPASADSNANRVLLFSFALCVGAAAAGAGLMCAFAPDAFLRGPMGAKWMRLIGVKTPALARLVCLVVALIVLAFLVGAYLAAFTDVLTNIDFGGPPVRKRKYGE